jgi:hypothetical protein
MKFYQYTADKDLDICDIIDAICCQDSDLANHYLKEYITTYSGQFMDTIEAFTEVVHDTAIMNARWRRERRPFFRLFSGFLESLATFDIFDKELNDFILKLPNNLNSIAIEFPQDEPFIVDNEIVKSVLYAKFHGVNKQGFYGLSIQTINGENTGYNVVKFNSELDREDKMSDIFSKLSVRTVDLNHNSNNQMEKNQAIVKIVILLNLLSQNEEIIKPIVMRNLEDKYNKTKDEKYVEKSIQRGLIGWNVGENILTKNQVEKMIREYELKNGTKSPHYRSGFWGLRATGKNRVNREIRYTHGTFVNEDLLTKIPHGFKGEK